MATPPKKLWLLRTAIFGVPNWLLSTAFFGVVNVIVLDIIVLPPTISHTVLNTPSTTPVAQKFNVSYPSFTNSTDFQLNGTAKIVPPSLQLTSAQVGAAGSAYYQRPINPSLSFQTQFQFSLHNGTSPPADGITFVIQSSGLSALGASCPSK